MINPEEIKANRKAVALAIEHLNKEFEKTGTAIQFMGDTPIKPWPAISSGAMTLDRALQIGGWPEGRAIELFGPEGSGKSTLALLAIKEAQAKGYQCAYIDMEHALDPIYARDLGVDVDNLLISQPDYGEMAFEIVDKLVGTGVVKLIVLDSVAALVPKAELDGGMMKDHMAIQPRMIGKALRILVPKADANGTVLFFINQIRSTMALYGDPNTTPGGWAMKHDVSARVKLRAMAKADCPKDAKGNQIGIRVKASVIKCKNGPPGQEAEFDIIWGKGIDYLGSVLDAAKDAGILTNASGYYKLADTGENFAHGKEAAKQKLAEDMEFTHLLEKKILGRDEES